LQNRKQPLRGHQKRLTDPRALDKLRRDLIPGTLGLLFFVLSLEDAGLSIDMVGLHAPFVPSNHIVRRTPEENFDTLGNALCVLKAFYDIFQDVRPVRITAQAFLKTFSMT